MLRHFLISMLALLGMVGQAQAQLVFDAATDPQHQALALESQFRSHVGYLEWDLPDGTQDHASVGLGANGEIFGAAHVADQISLPGANPRVGNGTNWKTDRGDVRRIVGTQTPTSWDGTRLGGSLDIAKFFAETPYTNVPAIRWGHASVDDLVYFVGYGHRGVVGVGDMGEDGAVRAFTTPLDGFGGNGYSTNYGGYRFSSVLELDLIGKVLDGYSGCFGFKFNQQVSDWEVVSIAVAQSGNYTSFGRTIALQTDLPQVQAFIPEPSCLFVILVSACLMRRRI